MPAGGTPNLRAYASAEQALLAQLLRSSVPDAIFFKDLRRRYTRLNQAECRILGVAVPDDVIGRTADGLLSAKRARMWRQEELNVLVMGVPLIDRVERVTLQDGSAQWLSSTKAPIRDAAGDVVGLVGITRDITQHKLQERLKEQFLSTVSHELRTPATSILGSLSLLGAGAAGSLPEPAERLVRIARNSCERLVRLINDLLDLQKMEAGMMAFDLKAVDAGALLEREVEAIQSFATPYGVTVRLAGADGPSTVRADPERLAQAVSNLLSNAVKFSPRGAEVAAGCDGVGDKVRIWVRDHGPGIPDAFRDRIYDEFVQVGENHKNGRRGTGLGLSVVKRIVECHQGIVDFEPAAGGGTVFSITLPAFVGSQESQPAVTRAPPAAECA